jgi:hypothetical protein
MRINMKMAYAAERPPEGLLHAWTQMLASEYNVKSDEASYWLFEPQSRQFVLEFLQSRGWKVTAYTTPAVRQGSMISEGFILADDCDQYVTWRLSQEPLT